MLHIRGRDCVAIEARYHKKCYKAYIKCLTHKPVEQPPTLYDRAFDVFCNEVILKRIVEKKEILLLSHLLRKFKWYVKETEGVDVPYQASRLKHRIQRRYPFLVFHSSKTMRKGTLVYSDDVVPGDIADGWT